MRKGLLFGLALSLGMGLQVQAQRYLSEVFTSSTKTSNVVYGVNISVLTGAPAADTLKMDVYTPTGDTSTSRPVIFVAHTGSFLPPPINGGCTGGKSDYTIEQFCDKMAKRGFVAVAFSYRLGWNPLGDQDTRTGTLLNAAYRGIQDIRTAARFMRLVAAGPNTYGVDPNKFVAGGFGTGGYISLGAGYLDSVDEIYLSKFINTTTFNSYVDTSLSGDPYGLWNRPLNVANHTGYSSDFQMVFNAGGAVGDSSWMEAGEPPVASLHVPSDPFAPFDYGAVIVPTTQQFVVNVSGSKGIVRQADRIGINNSINAGVYSDPVSQAAAAASGGAEALFPLLRPSPESGPWEYWAPGCPNDSISLLTNPDMSQAKADSYIDSTVQFLSPRIVCALGLPGCNTTATSEQLQPGAVHVFPNPSTDVVNIRSQVAGSTISQVKVMDLSGRTLHIANGLKSMEYSLNHGAFTPGMYLIQVQTTKGMMTQKVVFN